MGSSKRKDDYTSGSDHRDTTIESLNKILLDHKVKGAFRAALPGEGRGRGLDYIFYSADTLTQFLFMFEYMKVGAFYIKAEGVKSTSDAERYLKGLCKRNYMVILIGESEKKYSRILPICMIIKHWKWTLYSENENNANRIQFHGNWQDIKCKGPEEPFGLFDPPLWKQLDNLLA